MNPNEPAPVPQPAAAPPQPVAPVPPQPPVQPITLPPQPVAPVAPVQPAAPVPTGMPPKKPRNLKKVIIIAVAAIGGILTLLVGGIIILALLGGGVPKYTEVKEMELAGFKDTDPNSGMKFDYPAQMKDKVKTDLQTSLYHYYDDEDEGKGSYGAIAAGIQTVSYLKELTQEQKDQIGAKFQESQFDDDFTKSFDDGEIKNLKLSNKTASEGNSQFRADLNLDIKSTDDKYVPGKGVLLVFLKGKRVYTYAYFFIDTVYDANQDFLKQMEDSIEIGV